MQTKQERYDGMMRLLQEQDELAQSVAPTARQTFEPVIIVGDQCKLNIGKGTRIDSFVKLEVGDGIDLGDHVHIASFSHIGIGGGIVRMGDHSAVASGGKVISGSNEVHRLSMSAVSPKLFQKVSKSITTISRFAVVLTNATVLPGVTLHEGAVLAAGSVAVHDIPAWEIWGGVPAKFIGFREVLS